MDENRAGFIALDCEFCGGPLRVSADGVAPICSQCGRAAVFESEAEVRSASLYGQFDAWLELHRLAQSDFEQYACSECGASFAHKGAEKLTTCEFCGSTHVRLQAGELGFVQPDAALRPELDVTAACTKLTDFIQRKARDNGRPIAGDRYEWHIRDMDVPWYGFPEKRLKPVYLPVYEFRLRVRVKADPQEFTDREAFSDDLAKQRLPALFAVDALPGNATEYSLAPEFFEMLEAPLLADAERVQWSGALASGFRFCPIRRKPRRAWNEHEPVNRRRLLLRFSDILRKNAPQLRDHDFLLLVHDMKFQALLLPFYVVYQRQGSIAAHFVVDAVTGKAGVFPTDVNRPGRLPPFPLDDPAGSSGTFSAGDMTRMVLLFLVAPVAMVIVFFAAALAFIVTQVVLKESGVNDAAWVGGVVMGAVGLAGMVGIGYLILRHGGRR